MGIAFVLMKLEMSCLETNSSCMVKKLMTLCFSKKMLYLQ